MNIERVGAPGKLVLHKCVEHASDQLSVFVDIGIQQQNVLPLAIARGRNHKLKIALRFIRLDAEHLPFEYLEVAEMFLKRLVMIRGYRPLVELEVPNVVADLSYEVGVARRSS